MSEDELKPIADEEPPTEDEPQNPDPDDEEDMVKLLAGDLDIEAALAAVSELSSIAEEADSEPEDRAITPVEVALTEEPVMGESFPMPELVTLTRGQAASVVPGLVLALTGIWLTLNLTSGDSSLTPIVTIGLLSGGIGLSLLSYWQTSAGWSRGSFFTGLVLLLLGASGVFLLQEGATAATGWPLIFVIIGIAFWATAFFTQPKEDGLFRIGLLALVMGVVGYLGTGGILPAEIVKLIGNLWPIVLGMTAVIFILPWLFKRKGQ